jgi:hypothetical protein
VVDELTTGLGASGSGFFADISDLATASLFHFLPGTAKDSTTTFFGTGVARMEGPTRGFGDLLAGSDASTRLLLLLLPTPVGTPGDGGKGDRAGEEGADPAGLQVAVVPEPELEGRSLACVMCAQAVLGFLDRESVLAMVPGEGVPTGTVGAWVDTGACLSADELLLSVVVEVVVGGGTNAWAASCLGNWGGEYFCKEGQRSVRRKKDSPIVLSFAIKG